ncbi:RNA polymerase sigma factor (sigma-70 family) [Leucobacter luti]|uniref:RNA polymerase sigma factor (Sigma-70 family) n=1 Tax=Leucobacter luti TaxID=340320 RepID=A0A4R6RSF2_9MICO|nr:RNA polymerase sigma factor [Leucobacter luti]TDP89732.1 RNA polymerase sigma factor (sigma-70 family) [Leucobacter luti]
MGPKQHSIPTDEELLDEVRAGRKRAFSTLWERHHRAGLVAARHLAPQLDAEDLVSQAFYKILELTLRGFGPRGAFRPYLYRVIKSVAADSYRSSEVPLSEAEEHQAPGTLEPWLDATFDRSTAARAFKAIGERYQSALWYVEVEGLPNRDAAKLLGLSATAMSSLANRAREALRSAWVEAHLSEQRAASECGPVVRQLQRHYLKKLTSGMRRTVDSHLIGCERCSKAASELQVLNRQLGLSIATLVVGTTAARLITSSDATSAATIVAYDAPPVHPNELPRITSRTNTQTVTSLSNSARSRFIRLPRKLGQRQGSSLSAPAASTPALVTGITAFTVVVAVGAGAVLMSQLPSPELETSPTNASGESGKSLPRERATTGVHGSSITTASTQDDTADMRDSVMPDISAVRVPDLPPISVPEDPLLEDNPVSVDPTPETPDSVDEEDDGEGDPPDTPPVDDLLDPSLLPGFECSVEQSGPGSLHLTGTTSTYGALQARIITSPDATPVPVVTQASVDDDYGNTFTNILTGADPTQENWWWSPSLTPLTQWGLPDSAISDVTVELRLLDPNGRHSPWTAIELSDNTEC